MRAIGELERRTEETAAEFLRRQGQRTISEVSSPGGGADSTSVSFARITARAGTSPPFIYTADEVQLDASNNWVVKPDGAILSNNLKNIEEQGAGGQWVNPLLVGDIVTFYQPPGSGTFYFCSRSHYRGSF